MPAIQQIACFVAVMAPVVVVMVMNVLLALFGERGTLLLPRPGRYPRAGLEEAPAPEALVGEPGISAPEEEPFRKAA